MTLTRNLTAKLFALLFAIGFWVYVVSSGEKVRIFPDKIEASIFNVPEKVVVVNGNDLGEVQISVVALDSDFTTLRKEDIVAYVDVAGLEVGIEHEVPVKVTINNPKVKLDKVIPPNLSVLLDKYMTKEASVEVDSEGTIASDYTLGELRADQKRVRLAGAETVVGRVARVVAHLKLDGNERSSIERQVKLTALDQSGTEVTDVVLDPASVLVSARVEQILNTKTIGIVANLSAASPAAGHWIKEVSVSPSNIKVIGDPGSLSRIENIMTQKIEIADIDADLSQKISLILPAGVQLAPDAPEKVTVSIILSTEESTREIFADVHLSNLPAGLSVDKVDPGSVKVDLKGALPVMKEINTASVIVTIDASNAKSGNQRFTIDASSITVPDGVRIDTITPREVRVTFAAVTVPPVTPDTPGL